MQRGTSIASAIASAAGEEGLVHDEDMSKPSVAVLLLLSAAVDAAASEHYAAVSARPASALLAAHQTLTLQS